MGLLYAHDTTLVSGSTRGLQGPLDFCLELYHVVGLTVNVSKCSWFSIRGWVRTFVVNTGTSPSLDGCQLPTVEPDTKISYFGVPITPWTAGYSGTSADCVTECMRAL